MAETASRLAAKTTEEIWGISETCYQFCYWLEDKERGSIPLDR
jgi:hypothetical protein